MRPLAAALLTLALLLSMASAQQQEKHVVQLSASPPDCVRALLGAGEYGHGSQATIEVKTSLECRFVKWVLRGGGLPEEVVANPFTFYVFGDVEATALLEKLYRDNGTVIERVYVAFAANITSKALSLPKPKIVRLGEAVDVNAPTEVVDGDFKYIFLYWSGPGGMRLDKPSATIVADRSMTLVANYYTFKKFLDEYFPINIFVNPMFPDIQMPDGTIQKAVALRVKGLNLTLPIQPVPEPLLSLVEPVYEKHVPYTVAVEAPTHVTLTINGRAVDIGSSVRLLAREGATVVVDAPKKTGKLRLETVDAAGAEVAADSNGVTIALQLKTPAYILLRYVEIPYAFMLDIPAVGQVLYSLTETGYAILQPFTGGQETIPFYIAIVVPIAAVAAPGAGIALLVNRLSRTGLKAVAKAVKKGGAVRERIAPLVEEPPTRTPIVEDAGDFPTDSRFHVSADVYEKVADAASTVQESETITETLETENPEIEEVYEELERLNQAVEQETGGKFRSSLLQLVELDEKLYQMIQSGSIKLEKDPTPLAYLTEVEKLAAKVSAMPSGLVTVSGGERLLLEKVVETALSRAGKRWVKAPADLILPPDSGAVARLLKKTAKGADVVVMEKFASKTLAQAAMMSNILVVSVLDKGGDVEIPTLSERLRTGLTAWLLYEKDLLKRLDYQTLLSLVETSRIFRGADTVKTFSDLLEEGLSPQEALDELWTREFRKTFPGFEANIARKIMENSLSYGQARDLYVTAYKQVTAGGDPYAAWRRFLTKLEKLGVRIDAG